MEALLVVAQIIALVCISALCIYLIMLVLRVREILVGVERDLKEVTSRALPVLENLESITSRVKSISETVDDQVMIVRESLSSMRQIADSVVELERNVQSRIEGPILETVAFVAAVFKGVRTFVERVRA